MSFLNEAFQALRLVESEDFSLDKKGTEKLKDFLDEDEELDFVDVIDTEAVTQDDVDNVHVGMTVLGCDVCKSMHFRDLEDVSIDEESQMANVGEPCPYCFSTDGFKIVGTVAPFEDIDVEVKGSDKDVDVKVDGREVDDDKADDSEDKKVNESLTKIKYKRKSIRESKLQESPYLDTRFDSRKSFYNKARINDTNDVLYSYETKVMEMVNGKPVLTVGENLLSQTTLRHIKEWLKQKGFPAESKQQILRDYSNKVEEALNESPMVDLSDEEYAKVMKDREANKPADVKGRRDRNSLMTDLKNRRDR